MKKFICTLTAPLEKLTIEAYRIKPESGGLTFLDGSSSVIAFVPYDKIVHVIVEPKS
jgi:hypothetical protein